MKVYTTDITDVLGQRFAVHAGTHAGTVRVIPVGQPEREIVLDALAATQLRNALAEFLVSVCPCGEPGTASTCPGSWHGCQWHDDGDGEDYATVTDRSKNTTHGETAR